MIIKSSQNITKFNNIVISKHKGRLKKTKHDKLGFLAETRLTPPPPLLTWALLMGKF